MTKSRLIRRRSWLLLTVCSALAFTACSGSKKNDLTFSAIIPLTGPQASYGESERRGLSLAAEAWNAKGGVQGRAIRLLFEDSKGQANDAVLAAQKNLSVDGIHFVLSSLTGPSRAIIPVVTKAGALSVVMAMDETIPLGNERVIRIYPGNTEEGQMMLSYIKSVGARNVGILQFRNPAFDRQVKEVLGPELSAMGVTTDIEVFDAPDPAVLRSLVARMARQTPQVIILCVYYNQTAVALRVLNEYGLLKKSTILGGINFVTLTETSQLPAEMGDRTVVAAPTYVVAGEGHAKNAEQRKQFLEAFRSKYNAPPDYDAAYAYDALSLLASAIQKVGEDPDAVAREIRRTVDYAGASGALSVKQDGNASNEWTLAVIDGNHLTPLSSARGK